MNIFVFSLSRDLNLKFNRACNYIRNYSNVINNSLAVFPVPENQIYISANLHEWIGRLDKLYGALAKYVYLYVPLEKLEEKESPVYFDEVDSRIRYFLRDKPYLVLDLFGSSIDRRKRLSEFWQFVEAKGEFEKAVNELI